MQKLSGRDTYTPTVIPQDRSNCGLSLNGIECFIFGRRVTGYFDLRKLDGTRLNPSVSYKQISLLERAKTLLIERRIGLSSPCLKAGVSET
jgi:hypothetical protein